MSCAVKICGLSSADTIAAAIGGGARYVGFVFYPPSPRHVSLEQAASLAAGVPGHIGKVGVFVDADDDWIGAAIMAAGLDVVQLHGEETPERVAQVRARFARPIWRGHGVRTSQDIDAAGRYRGVADLLLFDAKAPKPPASAGGALPGGNGIRFDWRLLEGRSIGQLWGLSGGLDADNVAEAIRRVRPSLVDVSSGVEDAPGRKSARMIAAFLKAVQDA